MYAALWRALPGAVWVRLLILVVMAALILFALVTFVFPWVNSLVYDSDVTVGP